MVGFAFLLLQPKIVKSKLKNAAMENRNSAKCFSTGWRRKKFRQMRWRLVRYGIGASPIAGRILRHVERLRIVWHCTQEKICPTNVQVTAPAAECRGIRRGTNQDVVTRPTFPLAANRARANSMLGLRYRAPNRSVQHPKPTERHRHDPNEPSCVSPSLGQQPSESQPASGQKSENQKFKNIHSSQNYSGADFIEGGLGQTRRIPKPLRIDNCLSLTAKSPCFFVVSCKPISYCRLKRVDLYLL
jgi:hypothetical protein